MSKNNEFRIKTYDTKPYLNVTIKKQSDGTAINLTTASIVFNMKKTDDGTYKISRGAVNIVDAVNGICEYRWTTLNTNTEGVYYAEFEITLGGKVFTLPADDSLIVRIRSDYESHP